MVKQDGGEVRLGSVLGDSGRPIVAPTMEETSTSGQQGGCTHFLCVSPDAPSNPVLYWLGNFDNKSSRFILEKAKGPLQLDLGDILYAPNLMVDDKVQTQINPPTAAPYPTAVRALPTRQS